MATTIAFIVDARNEDETVRLASSFKSQLNASKVVATRTEKNKLDQVIEKKSIVFTTSLEVQGEKTIAAKASRGEVSVLVYLNPSTDESFVPRFVELLQQALKKHTLVALNYETAECILQYLSLKGVFSAATKAVTETPMSLSAIPSGKGTLGRQSSMAALQLLRSQTVADKTASRRVMNWSKQQLLYWLESNELDYLKSLFSAEGEQLNVPAEAAMFEKHESKSNMLLIKSGTPEKLVDMLVTSKDAAIRELVEYDEFVKDWFMTFHCFLKPSEFLRLLRNKYTSALEDYEEEEGQEIIDSVLHVMHLWIDLEKGADFEEDAELTQQFNSFVEVISKKDGKAAQDLTAALETALETLKNPPQPDNNAPAPQLSKKKYPPGVVPPLVEIEPLELAKQMTLMESSLLRKVRAKEFHGTAWTKKNADQIAPNLTKVINMSNQLSNWMITEILKLKTIEDMTEMICKFIKVGKHLVQMNNFSGAMEVVTALNNSAIGKLKAAWANIPAKTKVELDELNELTSPLGHYKNYRVAFAGRDAEQPCLPILAATLSDLNGFEEVFSNKMPDGSVNWKKMSRLADRIWENVSLNCVYNFKPCKELMDSIEQTHVWRENATTCAIADLRMRQLAAAVDKAATDKKVKRKSASVTNLTEALDGPKDDLSERDWQILLTGSQPKKFKAGQVIIKAGSPNEHLFRIKSGKVRVVKEIDGQEITVATMGENSMFGEVSMLLRSQKGTATASIIADGEVEIFQLQIEFVLQLLESHPQVAEKLNRILAIKLARRLRELGSKKPGPPPPTTPAPQAPTSAASSDASAAAPTSPALKDSKSKRKLNVEGTGDAAAEDEKKKEAAKDESPDAKFNKMFKLEGEVIIRELECSFKGNMTMHGSLYISQNYIGANFSMFGFKMREALPFAAIKDIKKSKKNVNIVMNADDKVYAFTSFEDFDDAFQFIRSIWKHQSGAKAPSTPTSPKAPSNGEKKKKKETPEAEDDDAPEAGTPENGNKWLPSAEDWDLILKGARTVTYKKDDVVIREGEQFRRIFQLARGECRFEKIIDGKVKVLGKMGKDSKDDNLFGEISFLEGGRASASVVCDKDDTQIAIIEGYFLEILFEYYPDLPGRFYHYLAAVLSKRLKQREQSNSAPAPVGGSKDTLKESGGSTTAEPEKKDKDKDKEKKKHKKKRSEHFTKSGSGHNLAASPSAEKLSVSRGSESVSETEEEEAAAE